MESARPSRVLQRVRWGLLCRDRVYFLSLNLNLNLNLNLSLRLRLLLLQRWRRRIGVPITYSTNNSGNTPYSSKVMMAPSIEPCECVASAMAIITATYNQAIATRYMGQGKSITMLPIACPASTASCAFTMSCNG